MFAPLNGLANFPRKSSLCWTTHENSFHNSCYVKRKTGLNVEKILLWELCPRSPAACHKHTSYPLLQILHYSTCLLKDYHWKAYSFGGIEFVWRFKGYKHSSLEGRDWTKLHGNNFSGKTFHFLTDLWPWLSLFLQNIQRQNPWSYIHKPQRQNCWHYKA